MQTNLGTCFLLGCIVCTVAHAEANSAVTTISDADIQYLFNGDIDPCASTDDAIFFTYGGAKAHQFVVYPTIENEIQTDDETISYIYSGDKEPDMDAALASYLYGGDCPTLLKAIKPIGVNQPVEDDDILSFFGGDTQGTVLDTATNTEYEADIVELMDKHNTLDYLTEWLPSASYQRGIWFVIIEDESLAMFLMGPTIKSQIEPEDTSDMADHLFGKSGIPEYKEHLCLHDVDLVDSVTRSQSTITLDYVGLVEQSEAADSEVAQYMYGGGEPVKADDEADLARALYGGDEVSVEGELVSMVDLLEAHDERAETDIVDLVEQSEAADSEVAQYVYGGNVPVKSDNEADLARVLYGGDEVSVEGEFVSMVDLLEAHDERVETDIVDLVEQSEAADSEVAQYMYGGNVPVKSDDEADLARVLYGGDEVSVEGEFVSMMDLLEAHNHKVMDLASLVETNDNKLSLFLLGGSSMLSQQQAYADEPNLIHLVDLVDKLEAEDAAVVEQILGGDAEHVHVGDYATKYAESDDSAIAFLYDGAGQRVDADIVDFLFGGDGVEERNADDSVTTLYLYGGESENDTEGEGEPSRHAFATSAHAEPAGKTDVDAKLIQFLLGGNRGVVSLEEELAVYLLGGDAASNVRDSRSPPTAKTTVCVTDKPMPMERSSAQARAPSPYVSEDNEDCSNHECISRTLRQLQEKLGLSDADMNGLDNGIVWGEDMIRFCEWQGKEEAARLAAFDDETCSEDTGSCPTAPSPMPPLPSSYSNVRPPSVTTCRQVLTPMRGASP